MAWGNLGCRGLYASSDFVPEGLVEDGIVDREHPNDLGLGFKVSDQVFLEQRHLRIVEGKRIIFSNGDVRSEENLEVDFGALREPWNVDENFVPLKVEPRSFCEMATEILLECSSLIGIFVEAGEVLEQGFVATIGNEDAADFVELPALESPHHTVTDVEFQATQFLLQAVNEIRFGRANEIGLGQTAVGMFEQILNASLEHRVGGSNGVMPIHVAVHQVTREDQRFDCRNALVVDRRAIGLRVVSDGTDQTIAIYALTERNAAVAGIP